MNAEQIQTIHRIADIESTRAAARYPCWLSAQDLYQEAWLHIVESWPKYVSTKGAVTTWALRKVRGHLYDLAISERRWGRVPIPAAREAVRAKAGEESVVYSAKTLSKAALGILPAATLADEHEGAFNERYDAVDVPRSFAAVVSMPHRTQRAAVMGFARGYSDAEIARDLGVRRQGVSQARRTGLRNLNAWATRMG